MSPFDKSSHPATRNQGYPDVERGKKGFIVRSRIGVLPAASETGRERSSTGAPPMKIAGAVTGE